MRIAIMQPYFIPYAGYFRLLQASDLLVAYDCVQFTRRGYLHRNQLPNQVGESQWLTLPLEKASQDIKISELSFAHDAKDRMLEQQRKFPLFQTQQFATSEFQQALTNFSIPPVNYILNLLTLTCQKLELPCKIVRSSELSLSEDLKGQDRIIAIAKHFNADEYINAPGGKDLYDEKIFQQHNLKLKFLSPYDGPYLSILPRLFNEDLRTLRNEIITQS